MAEADPTRSKTQRDRFRREFRDRWRTVRGETRREFEGGSRFRPQNDVDESAQVTDFREWYESLLDEEVIEPIPAEAVRRGRHYTGEYIDGFYEHGIQRANEELEEIDVDVEEERPEIIKQREPHDARLRQARVDTFHDLEDVGRATEQEATREYRDAVLTGATLTETIRRVNDRADKVGETRSELIADGRGVETINSAAIERYAEVGIREVGIRAEAKIEGEPTSTWRTAGDDRVCPQCQALAGNTYKISDIRNGNAPIPVKDTHPRCRCWYVPTPM